MLKLRARERRLEIQVNAEGEGTCVVECAGLLDIEGASELHAALDLGLQVAKRRLVLDLSRVTSMDSVAVGEILQARHRLRAGVQMMVRTGDRHIHMLLEIAGLISRSLVGRHGPCAA